MSNTKKDEDDINGLLNVTFDSLSGDLETTEYEVVKRKILQDQQDEYERIQRESFKKVKANHPPATYTITQWMKDEKQTRLVQNKKETDDLKRQQAIKEQDIEIVATVSRDNTFVLDQKTPSKPPCETSNPVTAEKEDKFKTISEPYVTRCAACREFLELCQKKQFSSYCVEAVDRQFRETPLSMTRRKCAQVFTSAYNRAYEFRKFQEADTLPPKAYYYTPACLKSRLREIICDIEEEQEEHISGKREFTTIHEIGPTQDIQEPTRGLTTAETSSEQAFEDYVQEHVDNDDDLCSQCGCDYRTCHERVFGGYCEEHVVRQFDLYPTAMTRQATLKEFARKYNDALHFWTFEDSAVFARRSFLNPPRCLEQVMIKISERVEEMHLDYIGNNDVEDNTEPLDVNMNLDGVEMEEY